MTSTDRVRRPRFYSFCRSWPWSEPIHQSRTLTPALASLHHSGALTSKRRRRRRRQMWRPLASSMVNNGQRPCAGLRMRRPSEQLLPTCSRSGPGDEDKHKFECTPKPKPRCSSNSSFPSQLLLLLGQGSASRRLLHTPCRCPDALQLGGLRQGFLGPLPRLVSVQCQHQHHNHHHHHRCRPPRCRPAPGREQQWWYSSLSSFHPLCAPCHHRGFVAPSPTHRRATMSKVPSCRKTQALFKTITTSWIRLLVLMCPSWT
mmetsp:Transcript_20164/g.43998  ORF Transcript_20164/g.43998 Transcript_20164/m.43998 type:complete len:259 (-) Transcript_20164:1286-2062(-)